MNNANYNDTNDLGFYGNIKTIDATGYEYSALLSGRDNEDNVIIGGNGTSSMWGGNGGNDTLIGGSGDDVFWYQKGSGDDTVDNADENDVVVLNDIKLDDLVGGSAQIVGDNVKIELNEGGSLTVTNAKNSGVAFEIEGTKYAVNKDSGDWEIK